MILTKLNEEDVNVAIENGDSGKMQKLHREIITKKETDRLKTKLAAKTNKQKSGSSKKEEEKEDIFLIHVKLGPVKARPVKICEDCSWTAGLIPTQYTMLIQR